MGIISLLKTFFVEKPLIAPVENPATKPTSVCSISTNSIPDSKELTYPNALPHFEELARSGHTDLRAVIYTMLQLDLQRKKTFSPEKLNTQDFGESEKAYQILLENELIQEPSTVKALAELYTQEELKSLLHNRNLPVKGNKTVLSERLLHSGFTIDIRKYRNNLFEITEKGINAIKEYRSDEKRAIFLAVNSLKEANYSEAISAYHAFDSKWGFVHTSGRNHTIFADYWIPQSRFSFIANYPMDELHNSDDFKNTLRSCIIACLMCGHKERWEIADCFLDICTEPICCPNIIDCYSQTDDLHILSSSALTKMQENVRADNRYTLEYYISHVKYLSKC